MNNTDMIRYRDWITGCALLLVLLITRSGHFGSYIKLPDASWAVFWLSGAFALRWYWPMILIASAALLDLFVINNGVSSYCVTPAYPFLIPSYLSLWAAGRWISSSLSTGWLAIVRIGVSILNGATAAFIISNYSFYLFAGYFGSLTTWQYTQATIQYWPMYVIHTTVYAATGLLIYYVVAALQSLRSAPDASST